MPNRILIPIALLLFVSGVIVVAFSQRPSAPRMDVEQPIPFSHRVHAGINKIPRQSCHEYPRPREPWGVPRIERCFGSQGSAIFGGIKPVTRPWTDDAQPP